MRSSGLQRAIFAIAVLILAVGVVAAVTPGLIAKPAPSRTLAPLSSPPTSVPSTSVASPTTSVTVPTTVFTGGTQTSVPSALLKAFGITPSTPLAETGAGLEPVLVASVLIMLGAALVLLEERSRLLRALQVHRSRGTDLRRPAFASSKRLQPYQPRHRRSQSSVTFSRFGP